MTSDPQDNSVKDQGDTASETNRCLVCREEIQPGARKCVHCGTWQNWRRHVMFDVRDLIALFGVLIAFSSFVYGARFEIQKLFSNDNSSLRFAYLSVSRDEVMIQAFNSGIEPGIVIGATLDVIHGGRQKVLSLKPANPGSLGTLPAETVEPRQMKLIGLRAVNPDIEPKGAPGVPDQCSLTIEFQNFKSDTASVPAKPDCEEMRQFAGMP